jgi:ADP-ribose pyrophosphatase YjhB (NUDIX family)
MMKKTGEGAMNDYIPTIRQKIGHDTLLLVGAGVFVHQNGRLLLQRRKDDGTWADHGGCIEIGETLEDTARREMFEETGLTAGKLELIGVYSGPGRLHTYPNGDKAYMVGVYYLCEDFTGTPLAQTDETTDLRWFPLGALPSNIMSLAKEPLRKCLEVLRTR